MSTTTFKRYQGVRLPAIEMTFTRPDGTPYNFTTYTNLAFRMQHANGSPLVTGVPTGDANGKFTYTPAAADFNVLGIYFAIFEGLAPGGLLEKFPSGDDDRIIVVVQEPPA